jgi:hypothetical protein
MAIQTYTHTQDTPSAEWTIIHEMGSKYVNIDVIVQYNGRLETILPQNIVSINEHQTNVFFSSPFSGIARVSK